MKVRDGYDIQPDGPGLRVGLDLDEVSKRPHRQGNRERREGGE